MLDTVAEIIRKSPANEYQAGVFARFKKIDDNWGLKFYYSESTRDETYERQSQAAAIGCAPKLGEKFDLVTPNGKNIFGYITEVAYPYEDPDEEGVYTEPEDIVDPDYNKLLEKLTDIMNIWDVHGGNIGYLSDGRLVVIDFSHVD